MTSARGVILTLRGAGWRYPTGSAPAVADVDLEVSPGEIVLLTGPTGCGKSTLLRRAAGLLSRHGSGEALGEVLIDGSDPGRTRPAVRVGMVGFVSQNPERQVVTGTLGDEVAFAPESAGLAPAEIDARVAEMLDAVGLPLELGRSTSALSGGQRQRLMVAAALAGGGQVLLLDEPLAQLDPGGAAALLARLRDLADRRGVAIVVVEHRLEPCLPVCDRVVVMDAGRVISDSPADELDLALGRRLGLKLPGLVDLADRLADCGLTLADAPDLLRSPRAPLPPPRGSVATLRAVSHRYPGASLDAVHDLSFDVHAGERLAIVGANGSGKSTLLRALAGALPAAGVELRGTVVDVPQDPDLALFCATVREELEYGPRERRRGAREVARARDEVAGALSIQGLLDRAPQALSRGQRLRVAVAAALACAPDLLLLDEPTSGQDHDQVERMMASLGDRAVVFATHDLDLALRHAHRVAVLDAGRLVAIGPPGDVARAPEFAALPLPPLHAWCAAHDIAPATPAQLAARARAPR